MIHRTLVAGLRGQIGETVTIAGWVKTLRLQSTMQFVLVADHTGTVQVTSKRGGPLEAVLDGLSVESAVRVTGVVTGNPIVKLGGLEIIPSQVTVANRAEAPLPIDTGSGPEHRMDWRILDLRLNPDKRRVFAVQTTIERAMREFAYAEGCTEMHTPKLMGTASESGAEVFKVGYFGTTAYLAQSPQFYKQMALAAGIDRVFEVAPVFRAEPSFTSRHSTEFTSVDVELAWVDGLEDVMDFEERMLAHVLTAVAAEHDLPVTVPSVPFPRVTMAEAKKVLGEPEGGDLNPEGERQVGAHVARESGHEFVFVTHYPSSVRPFYHMRPDGQPESTLSFDLLWKGMEITTGAQREHRYDVLLAQAAEKGLSPEPMRSYLDCFRYGCPPHGGFAIGLGRVLMLTLGLESLRDATFLFRGPNRLTPLRAGAVDRAGGQQRADRALPQAALPHARAVGGVIKQPRQHVAGRVQRRPPVQPVQQRRGQRHDGQRHPQPGKRHRRGHRERQPRPGDGAARRPHGSGRSAGYQPRRQQDGRPARERHRGEAAGQQGGRAQREAGRQAPPARQRRHPGRRGPAGDVQRAHRTRVPQLERRRRRAVVPPPRQPGPQPHPVLVPHPRPGLIPHPPPRLSQAPGEVHVLADPQRLIEPLSRRRPPHEEGSSRHVRDPRAGADDAGPLAHVE
jgi:aspartyl/asparaginyl-tRNA synthetase